MTGQLLQVCLVVGAILIVTIVFWARPGRPTYISGRIGHIGLRETDGKEFDAKFMDMRGTGGKENIVISHPAPNKHNSLALPDQIEVGSRYYGRAISYSTRAKVKLLSTTIGVNEIIATWQFRCPNMRLNVSKAMSYWRNSAILPFYKESSLYNFPVYDVWWPRFHIWLTYKGPLSLSRGFVNLIGNLDQSQGEVAKYASEGHSPESGFVMQQHFVNVFPGTTNSFLWVHRKIAKSLSYIFALLAIGCIIFGLGSIGASVKFGRSGYLIVAFVFLVVGWYLTRLSFWLDHS